MYVIYAAASIWFEVWGHESGRRNFRFQSKNYPIFRKNFRFSRQKILTTFF